MAKKTNGRFNNQYILGVLKNWKIENSLSDVRNYNPYYMGEMIL